MAHWGDSNDQKSESLNKKDDDQSWREKTEKMALMSAQFVYMLENEILTDCTFVVGSEENTEAFKAHRLQLARVSPVFEAMLLQSEMSEATTGNIRITDMLPNTFYLMLRFIYASEINIGTFEEARDVAFAADKYQIKPLFTASIDVMCNLVSVENIWAAFEISKLLELKMLNKVCMETLQVDTGNCISTNSFSEESEENVALLLEQDTLNETDELVLINVTVNWARNEARRRGLPDDDEGVRTVLEPRLLSLFRFCALSHQQFMFGPGLADWLTSKEKEALGTCLRYRNFESYPEQFSSALLRDKAKCNNERLLHKYSHQVFYCNRDALGSDATILHQEMTKCCLDSRSKHHYCPCLHVRGFFRVKTKCYLLGIQIPTKSRSTDYTILTNQLHKYKEDIEIEVFNCSYSLAKDLKHTKVCSLKYKKEATYNSTLTLMFHKKIPLCTDNWFGIFIKLRSKGTFGYCNLKRSKRVCSAGVEFVFPTKTLSHCHGPLNETLIHSLVFSLT